MKTKKILSVLMAVMMIFGCLGMSASALDWSVKLGENPLAEFIGLSKITSATVTVNYLYDEVTPEAEFTVYYSAEKEENILGVLMKCENVGSVGAGDAYLTDGLLHINLKNLGLSKEGYYYIVVGAKSLRYESDGVGYVNLVGTTQGYQQLWESIGPFDKLGQLFDYVLGMIDNLIKNGKTY